MSIDKSKFASCGNNVIIYESNVFIVPNKIHIGDNVLISEYCWILGGVQTYIGSCIHIANHCSIAGGGINIFEDFVSLSAGAKIVSGSDYATGEGMVNPMVPAEYRAVKRSYVHVKKHAFVATGAIVLPGVTIGEGAVIGAGAVVCSDVPDWTINIGNPAKPVKRRPKDDVLLYEKLTYAKHGVKPLDTSNFEALKIEVSSFPSKILNPT
jgi:dTDP-4-amino-4,6-dideoxy-D-glucose acyltransferase